MDNHILQNLFLLVHQLQVQCVNFLLEFIVGSERLFQSVLSFLEDRVHLVKGIDRIRVSLVFGIRNPDNVFAVRDNIRKHFFLDVFVQSRNVSLGKNLLSLVVYELRDCQQLLSTLLELRNYFRAVNQLECRKLFDIFLPAVKFAQCLGK